MKRTLALALALALLPLAFALALTGQSYQTFDKHYQANLKYFNDYENRHLLPLVLARRQSDKGDGRQYYELTGDILSVYITTDSQGVIEDCEIRLAYPAEGNSNSNVLNDYYNLSYQCVAFQVSMDSHTEVADRLQLALVIRDGLAAGQGQFTQQLGAYTLSCQLVDQSMVMVNFHNNGVPVETPVPSPTATPAPGESTPPPVEETVDPDDYIG